MNNTNNKRHLVYLASNLQGLDIERYEIQRLMAAYNMVNVGLVCRDDAGPYDWDLVRSQIESADLFILLVGDNYGPMLPTGISYLHREYVHARTLNKPILAFLKNCVPEHGGSIEQQRLASLHQMVRQQSAYKLWHLRDELLSHVRAALSSSLLTIGDGWLPAGQLHAADKAFTTSSSNSTRVENLTPRQRQALARQMLNLQVSSKVYQAGNLSLEESYVPSRLDLLYQVLVPLFKEKASEDRLRQQVEKLVYDEVKKELLRRHPQAHAVDDVRVSRSQFQKILKSWHDLGYIVPHAGKNRTQWSLLAEADK